VAWRSGGSGGRGKMSNYEGYAMERPRQWVWRPWLKLLITHQEGVFGFRKTSLCCGQFQRLLCYF